MTAILVGPATWSMQRDEEGHREYKLVSLVEVASNEGPAVALSCTGLPQVGDIWSLDADLDIWAFCKANAVVTPKITDEPNNFFTIEQIFSTKPQASDKQRCQDIPVEDPLLEPPKISGSFSKYQEEAFYDRNGWPIVNSAHEQIRGPQVEFDKNRQTIKITQNCGSALQGYILPSMMLDTVNGFPLWGLAPRCVKLSAAPWDRKYYGRCSIYYERTLEFEINPDTFDRDLLDEGGKVLQGHWDRTTGVWVLDVINGQPPQPYNPLHFMRAIDRQGNPMRVVLNGAGLPAGVKVISGRHVPREPGRFSVASGPEPIIGVWQETAISINRIIVTDLGVEPYVTIFSPGHGLATGNTVNIIDYRPNPRMNQAWTITRVDADNFTLNDTGRFNNSGTFLPPASGGFFRSGNINEVFNNTPIRVKSLGHGLASGGLVQLVMLNLDLELMLIRWVITVVDANHFTLNGSVGDPDEPVGTVTESEEQDTQPGTIHVAKYFESDFLLLGIPLIF